MVMNQSQMVEKNKLSLWQIQTAKESYTLTFQFLNIFGTKGSNTWYIGNWGGLVPNI